MPIAMNDSRGAEPAPLDVAQQIKAADFVIPTGGRFARRHEQTQGRDRAVIVGATNARCGPSPPARIAVHIAARHATRSGANSASGT